MTGDRFGYRNIRVQRSFGFWRMNNFVLHAVFRIHVSGRNPLSLHDVIVIDSCRFQNFQR